MRDASQNQGVNDGSRGENIMEKYSGYYNNFMLNVLLERLIISWFLNLVISLNFIFCSVDGANVDGEMILSALLFM
ncbi:MAG TPA: hypothetical protein DEA84_05970 [Erwinia persicina]|nr:hypothetical protein [Erwinia persicina]